jgi:hypothetical protein
VAPPVKNSVCVFEKLLAAFKNSNLAADNSTVPVMSLKILVVFDLSLGGV